MKFKISLIFVMCCLLAVVIAEDTPGFFLKVAKNVPRLGKRNNVFIKNGGKNIPRVGRRSGYSGSNFEDLKSYSHVQPFDSKFILDFLSDELFDDGDLKFVSWNDFDKALESDTELKKKLTDIARDKEIDDLKRLIYTTSNDDDTEIIGRPGSYQNHRVYQSFVPYDKNSKYNNVESDVYYYHNNDVKRGGNKEMM